ncbi:MAG: FkbM family methyltransferase [Gaiellaceae bacterium MAG52_C11]|nr:FkbM family methyltransferase [Candidatus Gaiellasilicea maunaloa]
MLTRLRQRAGEVRAAAFRASRGSNSSLTTAQRENAARLGELTGESIDGVVARLGPRAIPTGRVHLSPTIPQLLATQFVDAGVRDGTPYVVLPNGRTFYGLPSAPTHIRQHRLLRGVLDERIPEAGFICALDVVHRYVADRTVPVHLLPGQGGVVVEVGAYLGHKAIRMMDASIGDTGHFVGIELLPDNCELMARNFAENGFDNAVIVPEGVWNEPDRIEVMGKGRQRHTLVDIDGGRLSEGTGYLAPVNPLDHILERFLPADATIDFMYMSVNGAEIEALDGLHAWAERVRAIYVAANYQRDGLETVGRVRAQLADLGFQVTNTDGRRNPLGLRNVD